MTTAASAAPEPRRRRRRRRGRRGRPETAAASPTRHQRLAVFQTAVAAHTNGLDGQQLDGLLRRCLSDLSHQAAQLRQLNMLNDNLPNRIEDLQDEAG